MREAAGEHEGGHAARGMSEQANAIKAFSVQYGSKIVHAAQVSSIVGRQEAIAAIVAAR
jgi:hypothetical protein